MPSVKEALAQATTQLKEVGIASAALDAGVLLCAACGLAREQVLLNPDKQLSDKEISAFEVAVARRRQYEPIAYIIGIKEFWSLDFCVSRDTLIPRPDSETLVAAVLKRIKRAQDRAKPITILDIGTGTGCLLVSLLKELPEARGVGVDNSESALRVARENAKRHDVSTRAEFIRSHWCDALDSRTFDLILSNPPYIAADASATLMQDVVRYEPHAALFAGDGLDAYRALAPQMKSRLAAAGVVAFEIGQGQASDVSQLLQAQGLHVEAIEKDLAGIERCVIASLPN